MLTTLSRAELLTRITADPLLSRVFEHVRSLSSNDAAHDVEHLLRVARSTVALHEEPAAFRECVCAALLHDVVNLPKNHPERARASVMSASVARELLSSALDSASCERVAHAIEDHSYSGGRRPRSALGEALQDADRLEALGALGIARTFSTGVRLEAAYFDAQDPWGEHRELNDLRFSVDHFFTKLLKLPSTFCTERGRAEARERARILRSFLLALADEIGVPVPAMREGELRGASL
ncbi:MAG: HD domain-containing protein [Myxococcota bacterium]